MSAPVSASLDVNSLLTGQSSSKVQQTTKDNKCHLNEMPPKAGTASRRQSSNLPGQSESLQPVVSRACNGPTRQFSSYLKPIEELRAGEMATAKRTLDVTTDQQVSESSPSSGDKIDCSESSARIFSIFIGVSTTITIVVALMAIVVDGQQVSSQYTTSPANRQPRHNQAVTQIGPPILSRNNKPTYTPTSRASQVVAAAAATIIDHPKDPLLSDAEHYRLIRDQELHYAGSSIGNSRSGKGQIVPSSRRLARSESDADDSDDSDQDQEQQQQQQQQVEQKHRQRQQPLPAPVSRELPSKRKWSQPIDREQQDQMRAVARQLMKQQQQQQSSKVRPSAERRSHASGRKSVPKPQAETDQDGDYDEDNPPGETKQPEVPERRKLKPSQTNGNNKSPARDDRRQGPWLTSRNSDTNDYKQRRRQKDNSRGSSSDPTPDDGDFLEGQPAREELNEEANDETHFTRKPTPTSSTGTGKGNQSAARSTAVRKSKQREPSERRSFNNSRQSVQADKKQRGDFKRQPQLEEQSSPVDGSSDPADRQGDDNDDGSSSGDSAEPNYDDRSVSDPRHERVQQDQAAYRSGSELDNNNPNYLSSDGGGDNSEEPSSSSADKPDDSGSAYSSSSTSEVKLTKALGGGASRRLARGRPYSQPITEMTIAGQLKPALSKPVTSKGPLVAAIAPAAVSHQTTGATQAPLAWATKLSSPKKRDSSDAYNPQNNPSHAGKYFIN